jgi:transposase-like protein
VRGPAAATARNPDVRNADNRARGAKPIKGQDDAPRTIILDGYAASHRAVRELKADGLLPAETKLRSSKSLNNLIEQDHRGVKQRIATMLGFKASRPRRLRSPVSN